MIGASAAISGTMAAAMRFAFQRGGPLGFWRNGDEAYRVPAIPLTRRAERSARARLPGGVVRHQYSVRAWLLAARRRDGQVVAWQAHIGGFLAGLLLFSWFDPAPQRRAPTILVRCRNKSIATRR